MLDTMLLHARGRDRAGPAFPASRLAVQVRYAFRDLWRSPVVLFITLGFPLVFLIILGIAVRGGDGDAADTSVIQSIVPITAVFAAVMAAYVMLPYGIARARERGVLKRLRATPLPVPSYLTGRLANAVVVALAGTAMMVATAQSLFDYTVPWRGLPAAIVTLAVGVAAFAAIGFAVAMLVSSSTAVLAFTTGSFFLLAFGSGSFSPGIELPAALDQLSWTFPLRHFSAALDPSLSGGAALPAWGHLIVLVAWGAAGAVIGWRRWTWEPTGAGRHEGRDDVRPSRRPSFKGRRPARAHGDRAGIVVGQVHVANLKVWRDPASVFFSVAFPVLFALLVPYAFGDPVIDGRAFSTIATPAMAVFAVAVTAYVNLSEAVATDRERGVLKRLRGTPLPVGAYMLGRLGSVLWIAAITVAVLFTAAFWVHGVAVAASAWLPLAVVLGVGALALAALGLAVAALAPTAQAAPAIALGTFIPMAFLSDILAFGMELPSAVAQVAWLLPFKPLVRATETAVFEASVIWTYVAAVAAWGCLGALVAWWRFRWRPR